MGYPVPTLKVENEDSGISNNLPQISLLVTDTNNILPILFLSFEHFKYTS